MVASESSLIRIVILGQMAPFLTEESNRLGTCRFQTLVKTALHDATVRQIAGGCDSWEATAQTVDWAFDHGNLVHPWIAGVVA